MDTSKLIYEISTHKTFEDAIVDVTKALEDRKFGVLWKLNFKDKLKEKGLDFEHNFMIMEVCNPHQAAAVLSQHIDVGYVLPCKMVVYEDSGLVKIGFLNPGELISILGYDDLKDVAKEVFEILKEAIHAVK